MVNYNNNYSMLVNPDSDFATNLFAKPYCNLADWLMPTFSFNGANLEFFYTAEKGNTSLLHNNINNLQKLAKTLTTALELLWCVKSLNVQRCVGRHFKSNHNCTLKTEFL